MPEPPAIAAREPLRVLVLSKRQYMGRDLLDDRYGRFRELPLALAGLGMQVEGLCLSYRARPEHELEDRAGDARVHWSSRNLRRLLPLGAQGYWREVERIGARLRPQLVWACSDVLHAVLGTKAARRLGAKLVIDLYDNFEGYPAARIPGVNRALRQAVRGADGVSCISAPLERKLREDYGFRGASTVIENAIPAQAFQPGDRQASRERFGLPADGYLVGTAGALARNRGTHVLIAAFLELAREQPDLHLVLAGSHDGSLDLPRMERIHWLGSLPAAEVPQLLPAFDVSVVGNQDSAFGRYCFPQKLYESLACGIPVAVARVGAMAELLREHPRNLYQPGDAHSLVATLRGLRQQPALPPLAIPTWPMLGGRLAAFLQGVAADTPN
jgi:glycosyltransferase involved in cell wall biosynthesis